MSRAYPRLSIEDFGRHLLVSGDLDPVYIALAGMELDEAQRDRWLVAYWCLYHVGAACYLSERTGRDFWMALRAAATQNADQTPGLDAPVEGGRWPRGSERRHWRGEQARKAVGQLMGRYLDAPEAMVQGIASTRLYGKEQAEWDDVGLEQLPFRLVAARTQEHPSFGPWISFKVADMLDRLGIAPVSFDNAAVFMFDDPRKAALNLARLKGGLAPEVRFKDEGRVINEVVDYLTGHFKGHTAPPLHERPVGLQEVETILCKWKSHMNGHYPLNNDIHEINEGLGTWAAHSDTAKAFLHAMPVPLETTR